MSRLVKFSSSLPAIGAVGACGGTEGPTAAASPVATVPLKVESASAEEGPAVEPSRLETAPGVETLTIFEGGTAR